MSLLTHSFHDLGGLPGPLLSARGSITVWMHPVARVTCPCHLSLRDLRAEVISSRPSLASRMVEGTSSLTFTPHIQQIMALSFRRRIYMSSAKGAQVSPPWSIAERTQALKTLPRTAGDRCLEVRMGRSFLNLPQAAQHLAVIALVQPPPASSTSPR